MTIAVVPSVVMGFDGPHPVRVEVHVSTGATLMGFAIVNVGNLDDHTYREVRDRLRAAILSSGYSWPLGRVTINIAPNALRPRWRSSGSSPLDLAMAVGILVASGQLEPELLGDNRFIGELGLDGSIRRVPEVGLLVNALSAGPVVVPTGCEKELAPYWGWQSMATLADVVAFLERGPMCPCCMMRESVR